MHKIGYSFVLTLTLFSTGLFSQALEKEALRWMRRGDEEPVAEKRIDAYLQAIKHAPHLIRAYIRLGMEYTALEDYDSAEKALLKGYATNLAGLDGETKSELLYQLALTYLHTGRFAAAEDALRGAKDLTGNGDLLERVSLQLGRTLYLQGRYGEALREFQPILDVDESRHRHFVTLMQSAKHHQESERLYKEAERLVAAGDHRSALTLYQKVNEISPGFRDVEARIAETNAITISSNVAAEALATGSSRVDSSARLRTNEIIDNTTTQGDKPHTHNSGKPPESSPSQTSKDRVAEMVTPDHSRSASIPKVASMKVGLRESGFARDKKLKARKNSTDLAVATVAPDSAKSPNKPWVALPGQTSDNMGLTPVNKASNKGRWYIVIGFTLLAGGVALTMTIWLSKSARARFFVLIHDYTNAAAVYEKLLSKNPERLWLYLALARVYDLAGRTDPRAMRAYEMIQHLNLNGRNKFCREIARKYLLAGTQTVAVEILDDPEA